MARHTFGQTPSDWTFTVGAGNTAVLAGGVVLTMWSQAVGGVQYTDLLDSSSAPVTTVTSSDGTSLPIGTIPQVQGPDGVTQMWADAGGARYLMVATDLGPDVSDLLSRMEAMENAVENLQALTDAGIVAAVYDEGTATWPVRPAIAGTRIVHWYGPNASPPPSGYMVTNDQFFGWAS